MRRDHLQLTISAVKARLRASTSPADPASAYQAALVLLDDDLCASSSSDVEKHQERRISLYTAIIYHFLHHPTPTSLSAVHQLLIRQHSEGLPISAQVLTIYLKQALSLPSSSPMETIASVFPFLPETYDKHLLTLILSTTVRHARTPADEVKDMIKGCMEHKHGGKAVTMQEWDLELWDVYVGALLADGQLRAGIRRLPEIQAAAWAQQAQTGDAGGGPSPEAIVRPYISLLSHWIESNYPDVTSPRRQLNPTRIKKHSTVPRTVVLHAVQTLRGAPVPVELLNTWMSAERVAGKYVRAERIWETISGLRWDGAALSSEEKEGMAARRQAIVGAITPDLRVPLETSVQVAPDLRPDASSYTALFRLLKRTSRSPTRLLLRSFLSDPANIDEQSLNAALSEVFVISHQSPGHMPGPTVLDLPAALVLLQQFSPLHKCSSGDRALGVVPTGRTLDIVAAGLVRASVRGLRIFGEVIPRLTAPISVSLSIPESSGSDFTNTSDPQYRLSLQDWDRVSQELHLLRDDRAAHSQAVMLPVGRPFARLVDDNSPRRQLEQAVTDGADITRHFGPAGAADRSGEAALLLPALQRLMRRAIAAQSKIKDKREASEDEVEAVTQQAREAMGLGGMTAVALDVLGSGARSSRSR